jgi:NADH:ubiquinone oxidoreductase subunit E
MFTLMEVECLGACDRAPVVMINDDQWHERLQASEVGRFLEDLRAKGPDAVSGCHLCVEARK